MNENQNKYSVREIRGGRNAEDIAQNTYFLFWNFKKREHIFYSVYWIHYSGIPANCRRVVFENDSHFYECVKSFWRGGFSFIGLPPEVEFFRGRWCWSKNIKK